jgi:hypothetical protein
MDSLAIQDNWGKIFYDKCVNNKSVIPVNFRNEHHIDMGNSYILAVDKDWYVNCGQTIYEQDITEADAILYNEGAAGYTFGVEDHVTLGKVYFDNSTMLLVQALKEGLDPIIDVNECYKYFYHLFGTGIVYNKYTINDVDIILGTNNFKRYLQEVSLEIIQAVIDDGCPIVKKDLYTDLYNNDSQSLSLFLNGLKPNV